MKRFFRIKQIYDEKFHFMKIERTAPPPLPPPKKKKNIEIFLSQLLIIRDI